MNKQELIDNLFQEIKQRARELGYINDYRWGVEYPTNGKKPDLLPDDLDIMVRSTNTGLWCDERMVISNFWPNTKSFKITDDRYKPADTSYLVSEIPESKSNAESVNDWYCYETQKAVALPPVGTKCQVLIDNEFTNCTVIHHANNHLSVVAAFKYPQVKDHDAGHLGWSVNFRPLDWNSKAKAEKKRVVDAAAKKFHASIMHDYSGQPFLDGLSALYDAGYLRMPNQIT